MTEVDGNLFILVSQGSQNLGEVVHWFPIVHERVVLALLGMMLKHITLLARFLDP